MMSLTSKEKETLSGQLKELAMYEPELALRIALSLLEGGN